MRGFDEYGYRMCRFQGRVFELSLEKATCSSPVFLRRFMNSEAAREMDAEGFLFQAKDESFILNEIEEQYGFSSYGNTRYPGEEMYWMGYVYRYWCYTFEISSVQAYRLLKPAALRKFYEPYHTLDPGNAVKRIMESENIVLYDYTKRGVEILRRKIMEEQLEYGNKEK